MIAPIAFGIIQGKFGTLNQSRAFYDGVKATEHQSFGANRGIISPYNSQSELIADDKAGNGGAMKRVHLSELNDQAWLPASIRDAITDYLQYAIRVGRAYAPILPRLQNALQQTQARQVIDLCSGGGGAWASMLPQITEPIAIQLTDKYPNEKAFRYLQSYTGTQLTFYPASVDALAVPAELRGFRTLFSSFHHFAPEQARALLQDTVNKGEGIGIFEATQRSAPALIVMLLVPLIVLIFTPFIRPFRLSRLLWTYLIPVFVLFDGVVSCLRTYTPAELKALVAELSPAAKEYCWEIGEEKPQRGGLPVTYLIGYPKSAGEGRE